ncbi:MAG: hypothetical protein APF80_05785 [Alphaproteobacteria bacterium BRH_c36]|nr:MAG: hypothetical protein APF80_05785 [Alphaproteobacteria bacterium BRH_c36]
MASPDVDAHADRVVVFTRLIDAPPELVWRVWTTPEHVAAWWGPPGCENSGCEIDLRVGGAFRLKMLAPNGEIYPCAGRFLEVDPPKRFVIAGDDDIEHACGAGLPPGARVMLSLEEVGGKTALTLKTLFDTAAAREAANVHGYSTSWPPCLERMVQFVSVQIDDRS